MKLWNKTVILVLIRGQNSQNLFTKICSKHVSFQLRFFLDVHIFIYKGFPFIKYTFGGEINVVFQVLSSFRGNVKEVFVEKTR